MRDGQRKEKRVTPEEVKREGKQPHVSATGRALMYTPRFIAGHKFRKCLVDNASQANIISVKDCTKYGLAFSPGEIKTLYDFNDQEVPVQGQLTAKLSSFGPSKREGSRVPSDIRHQYASHRPTDLGRSWHYHRQ